MFSSRTTNPVMAQLAFFVLFPGFFFYHTALGTGLIGPVLGGYFSWMVLALAPIMIALYLIQASSNAGFRSRFDLLFFLYLLYFLLVVGFNVAGHADEDVVKNHLLAILQFTVVFIVFKMANFQPVEMRIALLVTLIGMTALIVGLSVDGVFYLKQDETMNDSESLASYQAFGRAYFMTALVTVAYTNSLALRLLIYAGGIVALFFNGARSELIALSAALFLAEALFTKYRLALIVAALIFSMVCAQYFADVVALFPGNRTLELLDISGDTSWQARGWLLAYGLRTIADNPVFGAYGSYVSEGGAGSYIHNILSAWVDLGLFGFLYLLGLIVIPMLSICMEMPTQARKNRTEEFVLVFTLLFVTVLFLFSSKTFTDILIAAALGRYSRYRMVTPAAPDFVKDSAIHTSVMPASV